MANSCLGSHARGSSCATNEALKLHLPSVVKVWLTVGISRGNKKQNELLRACIVILLFWSCTLLVNSGANAAEIIRIIG